jgi:hypothetical protein
LFHLFRWFLLVSHKFCYELFFWIYFYWLCNDIFYFFFLFLKYLRLLLLVNTDLIFFLLRLPLFLLLFIYSFLILFQRRLPFPFFLLLVINRLLILFLRRLPLPFPPLFLFLVINSFQSLFRCFFRFFIFRTYGLVFFRFRNILSVFFFSWWLSILSVLFFSWWFRRRFAGLFQFKRDFAVFREPITYLRAFFVDREL